MLTKINKQRLINAVKYTSLSYINKLLKIFYYFQIFYFLFCLLLQASVFLLFPAVLTFKLCGCFVCVTAPVASLYICVLSKALSTQEGHTADWILK